MKEKYNLLKKFEEIDYDLQELMHSKDLSQYDKAILQRDVIQAYTNKISQWLNVITNEVYITLK